MKPFLMMSLMSNMMSSMNPPNTNNALSSILMNSLGNKANKP